MPRGVPPNNTEKAHCLCVDKAAAAPAVPWLVCGQNHVALIADNPCLLLRRRPGHPVEADGQ